MKHFVFVESNTTGTGRLAAFQILAQGHALTFITRQRAKYPFLVEQGESAGTGALEVMEAETNDVEATHRVLEGLSKRRRIDAILTFSTFYVPLVAELAARLKLRYLNPAAASICHEKHRMRDCLRRAGLPNPEFSLLSSLEEAEALAETLTYPVVVKPVAESSSNGVVRVETARGLLDQYRILAARKENERGQSVDGLVLVETLLEGPEFSVETVSNPSVSWRAGEASARTQVVGVTAKHLSAPPYFVELGHDFPADLAPDARAALHAATRDALDAVGFDFGPAHTELRVTSKGPVVVEINPRLAGGMIPELVRHAAGIDLLGFMLDLASGGPGTLRPAALENDVASIRFITASRRGKLSAVHGLEQARALATVREVTVEKQLGTFVRPPENAFDRLGYVIASGPDRARVTAEVDEALRLIRLELEDI